MDIDREVTTTVPERPAAPRPQVSVIVPHYRDLGRLDQCLQALGRQAFPRNAFEIIVADNNSPEGEEAVRQVIAGRARLTVVHQKGAGNARNGGVDQARGDIFAFTDSDCLPEPEWLSEGVQALARYDFVGGRMKVLVGDPARMTPEEAFESLFAFQNESYVRKQGFTVTANLLCTREVFARVGGFVDVGVSEDCEWCYRARDAGYKIGYAAGAVVGHPARDNWEDLLKKWRRLNTEFFGLIIQRRSGRLEWLLRGLSQPIMALVHTPKALFGHGIHTFDQRLGALAVLYRLRLWRLGASLRLLWTKAPISSSSGAAA